MARARLRAASSMHCMQLRPQPLPAMRCSLLRLADSQSECHATTQRPFTLHSFTLPARGACAGASPPHLDGVLRHALPAEVAVQPQVLLDERLAARLVGHQVLQVAAGGARWARARARVRVQQHCERGGSSSGSGDGASWRASAQCAAAEAPLLGVLLLLCCGGLLNPACARAQCCSDGSSSIARRWQHPALLVSAAARATAHVFSMSATCSCSAFQASVEAMDASKALSICNAAARAVGGRRSGRQAAPQLACHISTQLPHPQVRRRLQQATARAGSAV